MSPDAICLDCDQGWTTSEVEEVTPDEIPHFWKRVASSDITPLGTCPSCEGLCLPTWGPAYTQSQRVNDLCEVVASLLEWSEQMGGWDAPCWNRARRLLQFCTGQGSEQEEATRAT